MANFCGDCGKELEEGQVCNCKEQTVQQSNHVNQNLLEDFFRRLFSILVGVVKTPADGLSKYIKDPDFAVGLTFIGVQAFLVSLFMSGVIGKIYSSIADIAFIGSLLHLELSVVGILKIFFITFFISLILSAAFLGILILFVNVILKGKVDYKK